ncbi:nickel pincer cofactor biosynthesis protein LarB [Halanaerobium sp. Z-7514]|uniref:Nickel pincer cofactor biosynthesis protein LarB n=1 Tax=Halanaerobium polyolivorans TaxID=2886943 RepID=A0AAW4X126_9FIRM|nr:nickel pincer cofactor biosynthesis protein LarB [Halanaerobium polyolivorans]MCC3145502.1 nickel pincer cofactor biosynthesis protein LarB [Halanaerobium polyolivorans]RQD76026.1 MAG: nickel pincer cofactor biosynthesis protein LarB [Halanaerobium sp. MSAO_Bac5]
MNKEFLKEILKKVKSGEIEVDKAADSLKDLPYKDLGYARVDHHRSIRNGFPEVIYCEGKSLDEIEGIVAEMLKHNNNILASRATKEVYQRIKEIAPDAVYHERPKMVFIEKNKLQKTKAKILVVSGGTSDMPVAEEAVVTAKALGTQVDSLYDVGVAGLHRLLGSLEKLDEADVIIVVAGMEGALASVVGGLVDKPVIAVPTSVGYGANFGGLSSLLTMINSCASGVGVVNIDNGFGAAYLASTIILQIEKARREG